MISRIIFIKSMIPIDNIRVLRRIGKEIYPMVNYTLSRRIFTFLESTNHNLVAKFDNIVESFNTEKIGFPKIDGNFQEEMAGH